MTGYDVAEWVRSMKPDLKVLLTSGYSDMQFAVSEAVREIKVLGKPYTREQLACALREALDGRPLADNFSHSRQSSRDKQVPSSRSRLHPAFYREAGGPLTEWRLACSGRRLTYLHDR